MLGGEPLELPLHVVDLRRTLLAVEHPGADLDRLRDRVGGLLAGLSSLANHAGGTLVADRQRLDHEAIANRPDRAFLAAAVEWELWLLGGFHWTLQRSRVPGRNLTIDRVRSRG